MVNSLFGGENMQNIMNSKVKTVLSTLKSNGFSAYLVGGCVRDQLLLRQISDYDITTDATPDEILKVFDSFHTIKTGIKHGTVTVIIDKTPFEITTFRTDGIYQDNRHPSDVRYVKNLKEDLARRDFTINSMAMEENQTIIDYYNSIDDINNKIIRCVGNPDMRFKEDSLRILRALRFSSQLGFKIEDDTKAAIYENKHLLHNISAERISQEFSKLLLGPFVTDVLIEYKEILAVFIPEFIPTFNFDQHTKHHCYDVYTHIVKSVESVPQNLNLRLTMLLHDIAKPECYVYNNFDGGHFKGHQLPSSKMAYTILKRLKYPNKTIEYVVELIKEHDNRFPATEKSVKKFISKHDENFFYDYILIRTADTLAQSDYQRKEKLENISIIKEIGQQIFNSKECYNLSKLDITGHDLISSGISQGEIIGEILDYLLEGVIEGNFPNNKLVLISEAKNFIKLKNNRKR